MVSKELITIYKCDRCGKQMDSQYAILTLKHARNIVSSDDLVNKDLCFECFLAIQKYMGNDTEPHGDSDTAVESDYHKNLQNYLGNWISTTPATIPDIPMERVSGTWAKEPLNKHLDVTCI